MNNTENRNPTSGQFKDISRFTRWVNDFDLRDKSLNATVRKRKWILIVAGIFFLFVLSFVLFPLANLKSQKPGSSYPGVETNNEEQSAKSAFELPVDSFENQLKQKMHEELPEK
jgi:hypothetical protein